MKIGSDYLTADSVVGVSGKPVRIYSVTALSGATAGKVVLRNGTTSGGTIYVNALCGTVSQTNTFNFEGGMFFPDGCFFDKDANVTSVVVCYEQVTT